MTILRTLCVLAALCSASLVSAQPIALPPPSNLLPPDATLNARVGTLDRLAWADGTAAVAAYRACNFTRGDVLRASFRKRWHFIETIYGAADSFETQYPLTLSSRTLIERGLTGWAYSLAKSRVDALVRCLSVNANTYSDNDLVDASELALEEAEFSRKHCDPTRPIDVNRYKRFKTDLGTAATELERRASSAKGDRKKRLTEAAKIARERLAELPSLPDGKSCDPETAEERN